MTSVDLASPAWRMLAGYPAPLVHQADALWRSGELGAVLRRRHAESHQIRDDAALYDYVQQLKTRYLRKAEPLQYVGYDAKLRVIQHALGLHTRRSQQQGAKLKTRREIRVASLFRDAPAALLRTIVVHELAHLKELDHSKAFYQLCQHMEPEYFQLEFDVRLWLLSLETAQAPDTKAAP